MEKVSSWICILSLVTSVILSPATNAILNIHETSLELNNITNHTVLAFTVDVAIVSKIKAKVARPRKRLN
ncbi:hypothetical protein H0A36_10105 [Endozoicomonas sp. SM1973]|uniref:Uncharacterized protein n=1 Tax=Spartinivicinus marinus TaxID=2994442 RepID=A0A853I8F6_9GAMM|nr:hypothetical protein [Spartinivicinus marinus]MCX4027464.1 hypothetical protein [Spartinivicinus marinus]NYZ66364.1 hypothetical protein [Spartinivicinus marinus]